MINFCLVVPRVRRIVARLPTQGPGFEHGLVLVRCKALGQVLLQIIGAVPVSIITPMLYTDFHLLVLLIGQNLGTFKYINAFPDSCSTVNESNFVVRIATRHGKDGLGFETGQGQEIFSSPKAVKADSGAQPVSNGYRKPFSAVKRPGRKVHYKKSI